MEQWRAGRPLEEPKPRSRIVEAIAILLLARPMRAAEIARELGKSSRYVSSYLSYWRSRGLFEYNSGFWSLTPKGEEFAKQVLEKYMSGRVQQYSALARSIIAGEEPPPVKAARNSNTRVIRGERSGGIQPFTAPLTSKTDNKQQVHPEHCIAAAVDIDELDPEEREVLEHLLSHYQRWGSTYTYLDELARAMNADAQWLLAVARRLQAKQLIYIYRDRQLGVRIGLSRRLREQLSLCRGGQP